MHGSPGCRLEGGLWHQAASEAGIQIVCPDRPGIGNSTLPSEQQYSLFDFAKDCNSLLVSLDVTDVYLLGYAEGASAALACATHLRDTTTKSPKTDQESQKTESASSQLRLRGVGIVHASAPLAILKKHWSAPGRMQSMLMHLVPMSIRAGPTIYWRTIAVGGSSGSRDAIVAGSILMQEKWEESLSEEDRGVLDTPTYRAFKNAFVRNRQEGLAGDAGVPGILADSKRNEAGWNEKLQLGAKEGGKGQLIQLWCGERENQIVQNALAKWIEGRGARTSLGALDGESAVTIIPRRGRQILSELIAEDE